jgi:hypothetical protein
MVDLDLYYRNIDYVSDWLNSKESINQSLKDVISISGEIEISSTGWFERKRRNRINLRNLSNTSTRSFYPAVKRKKKDNRRVNTSCSILNRFLPCYLDYSPLKRKERKTSGENPLGNKEIWNRERCRKLSLWFRFHEVSSFRNLYQTTDISRNL